MYHHGIFDPHTFSVNPLGLVLGLARACEANGARIYGMATFASMSCKRILSSMASRALMLIGYMTRGVHAERTRATGLRKDGAKGLWHVSTESGASADGDGDAQGGAGGLVKAREVVLATNANMKGLSPALER
jgi:glycine/D-amino acid oxidase-like deaminating enzyme